MELTSGRTPRFCGGDLRADLAGARRHPGRGLRHPPRPVEALRRLLVRPTLGQVATGVGLGLALVLLVALLAW